MTEYAFEGDVIRLTHKDYDKWKATFHNIPNLDAVLLARDAYLASEEVSDAERKRWFLSTANYLVNADAKFKGRFESQGLDNNGLPKFKTLP